MTLRPLSIGYLEELQPEKNIVFLKVKKLCRSQPLKLLPDTGDWMMWFDLQLPWKSPSVFAVSTEVRGCNNRCRYVTDADLAFFKRHCESDEPLQGATNWVLQMDKNFPTFSYAAWRRVLPVSAQPPPLSTHQLIRGAMVCHSQLNAAFLKVCACSERGGGSARVSHNGSHDTVVSSS